MARREHYEPRWDRRGEVIAFERGSLYGLPVYSARRVGYGPIDRSDGLDPPANAPLLARRRLLPLVERMHGDHGFEVGP